MHCNSVYNLIYLILICMYKFAFSEGKGRKSKKSILHCIERQRHFNTDCEFCGRLISIANGSGMTSSKFSVNYKA